jgi:hypothetical protein
MAEAALQRVLDEDDDPAQLRCCLLDGARRYEAEMRARKCFQFMTLFTFIEDGTKWRIASVRVEDMRSRFTLETPSAMLPSPSGRKMRVARNAAERKWMLAIGPDISRERLMQREQIVREDDPVRTLQQRHDRLLERAAELEAEAKYFRKEAEIAGRQIKDVIREGIGPVAPFTETYDFQCDEATAAQLAAMPQSELVNRLVAARGSASGALVEVHRGYWGDMTFMASGQIEPGPGAWTGVGSPEWLAELFPNWNDGEPAGESNGVQR